MTSKSAPANRFSLRRWSQRKLEAARSEAQTESRPAAAPSVELPTAAAPNALRPETPSQPSDAPLPPIESLSIDSDYAPFFKPTVDESIKRAALKQLFRDPRFNIMDGLDTYIDDYTQPDPIPAAMLDGLMQRRIAFLLPEAPNDSCAGADNVTAADRTVPTAAEIAPPATAIAPAESAPDQGIAANLAPETGIEAKTGKP
jgi:hypothetical protein